MNKNDFDKIIQRYKKRLEKHGRNCLALGWKDVNSQKLRFRILSEIGDLNSTTLLDVGCGFGDFYKYLKKREINIKYTGIDIYDKFIEIAKMQHPNAEFMVKNIISEEIDRKFDYVFLSGTLNTRVSKNHEFAEEMLTKMYHYSLKGISANMLTAYVDFKKRDIFYYSPEKIFSFCKTLSKYVVLRHDYPLYEFTVYIYKRSNL